MVAEGKMVFTAREAADYLGVSYNHMLACLQRGALPAVRLGDKWLIARAKLEEFLGGEVETRRAEAHR